MLTNLSLFKIGITAGPELARLAGPLLANCSYLREMEYVFIIFLVASRIHFSTFGTH